MIAYNAEFDAQMLAQTAKAHGLYWPGAGIRWRCAMRDYAAWRRVPRGDGWSWHPLWAAASREGVEARQSHRALGDARLVLALMQARPEIGAASPSASTAGIAPGPATVPPAGSERERP